MTQPTPQQQRRSVILVLLMTLINAASQVLIKIGAAALGPHPTLIHTALGIFTNSMLFSGYALLGVSTVMMVLALRHGELSLLYPFIALNFVWVTILSKLIFKEVINAPMVAGIIVIMAGVGTLGRGCGPVKTPVAAMGWVLLAGFFGSFGAAFLKAGAGKLAGDLKSILTNWRLAAGIGAYLVSSVFFVKGVNEGELSVLYPLVAVGYGWTLVWSKLFFHEPLTPIKFTGMGLVVAGLALLGYGASLR